MSTPFGAFSRMPKRVPLPPELRAGPFLFREARDHAVGAGRLRSADLDTPFRGVRVRVDATSGGDDQFLTRRAAYAPLLVHGRFFSHLTSARLWGVPLPQAFEAGEPLHVSCQWPVVAPRMVGILGHQTRDAHFSVTLRRGFKVSDPISMWLSLGGILPPNELIVVADYLILDPAVLDPLDLRPHATLEQLQSRLESFRGRGSRALQRALPHVRMGSESRPETLLRLLLLGAGLPEPALNVVVTAPNGRVLGRGDMIYERWHTIVEYDGDQHRTSTRQYDRDIHRLDSFRDAGWRVVQVRSRGLFVNRAETVSRVAAALKADGWPG